MDYTGFADVKIDKTINVAGVLPERPRPRFIDCRGPKQKSAPAWRGCLTLGQLTPWLLTVPLVLGWIWWGVRRGLRLCSLTDQIASQQPPG